ncbi:MAG: ribonuclease P protein component [Verrucomicrobiales bacterium]
MSLPRPLRMTRRREFEAVRVGGTSAGGRLLAVSVLNQPDAVRSKFGVIVPKALGAAPTRNRIKRRLRAIIQQALPILEKQPGPARACVTIARRASPEASFADLYREWHRLARQIGLWPPGHPVPPVAGAEPAPSTALRSQDSPA